MQQLNVRDNIREGFINIYGICVYPVTFARSITPGLRFRPTRPMARPFRSHPHAFHRSPSPQNAHAFRMTGDDFAYTNNNQRLRVTEPSLTVRRINRANITQAEHTGKGHDSNAETHSPSRAVPTHAASDRRTFPAGQAATTDLRLRCVEHYDVAAVCGARQPVAQVYKGEELRW
ncbi:hypothetical protein EDB89DRAFT_2079436 [Lactarius sanguifluus]|nr:hypothetical protein EDB89DRAFT_2079436 [Lactarius sanguifluus]